MNLVRFNNPARLSNIFDNFFDDDFANDFYHGNSFTRPAANIIETKDDFEVDIAAPGMNKKDFKINLENNVLSISTEKKDEFIDENKKFTRKEFIYNSFKRSFTVPRTIETEKIKAEYKDGILKVKLPKKAEAKVDLNREITVV